MSAREGVDYHPFTCMLGHICDIELYFYVQVPPIMKNIFSFVSILYAQIHYNNKGITPQLQISPSML